jgi:hypothetical protein
VQQHVAVVVVGHHRRPASLHCRELTDQLAPSCLQVSADDAIEGMAYYIAMYLSRAPEARHMEPKQLQAALKQTFTVSMTQQRELLQAIHAVLLCCF